MTRSPGSRRSDRELARLASRDALAAGLADALAIMAASLTVVGVLAVAVASPGLDSRPDRDARPARAGVVRQRSTTRRMQHGSSRRTWRRVDVLDLVDHVPAVRDPLEPRPAPPRRPVIALECVSARYEERTAGARTSGSPARARRPRGTRRAERIAARRPSRASCCFLDPELGRVTIAGHDIREYRQEDVRATFALAGQDAHLFDTTIRANLELARPAATDGELWAALRRARLADWVVAPPRAGHTCRSGGARALRRPTRSTRGRSGLLADAPVLLLDEPTAHPITRQPKSAPRRLRRGGRPISTADHTSSRRTRPC